MRFPLLVRVATVAVIALALLLPLATIQSKIAERRTRADAVQNFFAAESGGAQIVAGPFLVLTCEEPGIDPARQRPCPSRLLTPARLEIDGKVPVEQRYRGIYPIRLYRAQLALSGEFELPPRTDTPQVWKRAYLLLAVSDPRGIKNAPSVRVAQIERRLSPGAMDFGIKSGLHASLGNVEELRKAGTVGFDFALELTGTSRLDLLPVGDLTRIRLASAWPHPSLSGAFSADEREVTAGGFSAVWRINQFATGGAPHWRELAAAGKLLSDGRAAGVSLVEPVNVYSLSFRATEYGFLFVLFSFAALSLVEFVWGVRLHPVQYAFVGLALAVFFLVLIALSEHLRFAWSYAGAASACVALLTYYLRHPLGSVGRTAVFATLFSALYCALYLLLRSEDHALLAGALLVFAALAVAMILTRGLDWDAAAKRLSPDLQPLSHPGGQ
jgi:inner membrane protein